MSVDKPITVPTREKFLSLYYKKFYGIRALEKYPFWFSDIDLNTLARIVGDITSDGHLSVDRGIIQFISKNRGNLDKFNERIASIFKLNPRIRASPSNKSVCESIILNKPLCRFLFLCGVTSGNKVLKISEIPDWILDGNTAVKTNYLRGLFDGEGSVYFQDNRRIRIPFDQYKVLELYDNLTAFMNVIRKLLSDLGINSTNLIRYEGNNRKDGKFTVGLKFEIYGTKNNLKSISNFKNYIDFDDEQKRNKLHNAIKYLETLSTPQ